MTEQMTDSMKGTADSIASTMQPQVRYCTRLTSRRSERIDDAPRISQSEKSTTQKAGDAMSGNSNESSVRTLYSVR